MIGLEPNISHEDFLAISEAVASAESVSELVHRCNALSNYSYASYHHKPSVGSFEYETLNRYWSTGISKAVHDYLDVKGIHPDPVTKYVFSEARPFWLSDLLTADELVSGESRQRIKLALKEIGDGVLIPLFGPFYKRGYIFIGFGPPRRFFDDVFIWQLQSLLQIVHNRYCVILESLRARIKLTARESEVLELISFGKTNPEIGTILGISTHTVSGHVKRIFLKFNATDRVTVALRARSFTP